MPRIYCNCLFIRFKYLNICTHYVYSFWNSIALLSVSFYSITEISTVSPPGLLTSALATGRSRQESYINVTWTPAASQHGTKVFCYSATDNLGYVEKYLQTGLMLQQILVFSFILPTFRLTSQVHCITIVVRGMYKICYNIDLFIATYGTELFGISFVYSECSSENQNDKLWEWNILSIFAVWSTGTYLRTLASINHQPANRLKTVEQTECCKCPRMYKCIKYINAVHSGTAYAPSVRCTWAIT